MNQDKQPDALRIANSLQKRYDLFPLSDEFAAVAELNRQHARIAELEAELAALKAAPAVGINDQYEARFKNEVGAWTPWVNLGGGLKSEFVEVKCSPTAQDSRSAIATPQAQDVQDAARWREAIKHVGAENQFGRARYVLNGIDAPFNVMRGGVSGHFTNSIDAALAASAKGGV